MNRPAGRHRRSPSPGRHRAPRWLRRLGRRDRGSALIEAAVLIVVLVVPMFYLVATLGRLQAGALAATSAAREAGRAFVTAPDTGSAAARAEVASGLVLESFGFTGDGTIALSCDGVCLEPGGTVRVRAEVTVVLPLVPDFVRGAVPAAITVDAAHTETVDEFRGAP